MESFARHQAVGESQDHDEGLDDGAAGGGEAEEGADVAAVPGRLGDVAALGPPGALAGAALDLDVEGGPPLPVVRGRTGMARPALAGGEVVEAAVGVERGQGTGEVLGILDREMAADEVGEVGVHGGSVVVFEY